MLRLDGLTYEEIAKEMNCTVSTAYWYICSAMGTQPKAHNRRNAVKRGLYQNIEWYLVDHNLTDKEFAKLCGISQPAMSALLTGKHAPSKAVREKVAKAMNMSVEKAFEVDMAGYM